MTSNDKIFWSVQKKILMSMTVKGSYGEIACSDSTTRAIPPALLAHCQRSYRGDIPLTRIDSLRPFGINSLNEHFLIETLNGDKMILKSKVLQLNLRKF